LVLLSTTNGVSTAPSPRKPAFYRDRFHDVAAKEEVRQQLYDIKKRDAEKYGDPVPPPPTQPVEGDLLARAFNVDCEGPNSFAKLARYESALERSIDRCLRQLKAYQAARSTPDPGATETGPQTGPQPPQRLQKHRITKRTQEMGGDAQYTSRSQVPSP
jgi:hypothetical protein